jgi:hypothetical protein
VNATLERPAQFSAISFEKALNLLIKTHLQEVQYIEQNKEKILSNWNSTIKTTSA